ncbi:MAG TPA: helix-turn-helix domain-containing protein, partial [Thermoleophilaceae bacterium]|nr:helix-turn-helix domain-containing protein [Thermoleophilaceae bacterium]
ASQRGRMLDAMARAVADKGYASTTVRDVIGRARVSRETFYEQFANKEECFLAALDTAADALLAAMAEALGEDAADPVASFERSLAAYLDGLAKEPAYARTFLIEAYAAGPESLRRRFEVQRRFVEATARTLGARSADERFRCEAVVGAVSSLVTARVAAGEAAELPRLRRPVMRMVERLFFAR